MARLLVKKTPWWVAYKGQALFWLPMATLQAGTLTGLTYAWDRLSELEQQASHLQRGDTTASGMVNRETAPQGLLAVDQVSTVPASSSPVLVASIPTNTAKMLLKDPHPVAITVAKDTALQTQIIPSRTLQRVKQTVKPDKAAVKARPKNLVTVVTAKNITPLPKVSPRTERAVAKAATTALTPQQQLVLWEAAKTAHANRDHEPERLRITPLIQSQEIAIPRSAMPKNSKASTVPVGSSVWVYLGQLRDYGWYGQKLHISPSSGLPEVGRAYLTQQIHGYYDAPNGKRSMGGFQQGDKVVIQRVVREENGDVWAKVFKELSVGRSD